MKAKSTNTHQTLQTLGYFALNITLGLISAAFGPTLPSLAERTHTQMDQIGFIFTARSIGVMLGAFQGGRVYDRIRGHPVVAAALIFAAAMTMLIPLMRVLWLLALVLLLLGTAEGILNVGINSLIIWAHPQQVGPFMNGLHFFFGLGSFLSPVIIAQAVLISGDITWAYAMLTVLMFPVALWLLRVPSPLPNQASQHRPAQTNPSRATSQMLIILVALFLLLYVGAEISFGGWIFTYAVALDLSDSTTAAYLTSLFWGALTLGRLLSIPIAARSRPRSILLIDLTGCFASLGLILASPQINATIWPGTFGLGFSMASIFPTAIALVERRMHLDSKTTRWFFVGASIGGMTLPWLAGNLFEHIGPQAAMLAIVADLLIAAAILAAILRCSAQIDENNALTTEQ